MTWEQFWETVSVAEAALWVGGIGVALAFIVKMWPFIRKFFNIVDALTTLPEYMTATRAFMNTTDEKLDKQYQDITDIRHEVQYNNGSSVKDAVSRIENAVKDLTEADDDLHERVEKLVTLID